MPPVGREVPGQPQVDDARLDDGVAVAVADLEDFLHPRQGDDDSAADRETAAGEAGAGAARQEGDVELVARLDDLDDLLGRGREDDDVGTVLFDGVAVTLVDEQLGRRGDQAVPSDDGAEALDYLCRRASFAQREPGNPALVLLDLKMPKVDGLEVLRHVKSDSSLKTIPVVVLTSSREEQDVVRSYDLGVNAYVVKPVDFHAFIDAVKLLGGFWAVLNELPPAR